MDWLEPLVNATEKLGLATVAMLILLGMLGTVVTILTKKLIDFLGHIIEIRRKIVDKVSESHTELAITRVEMQKLLREIEGLRSDVREFFKIFSLFGPYVMDFYKETIAKRALPRREDNSHGDD